MGNVPAFVGRESELHQLRELRPRPRMLTLTGPGGAGKSRLARELAATLVAEFEHGVHVLDLDEDMPSPSLWRALRNLVRVGPGLPEDIVRQLALQHLLLVLDNCDSAIHHVAQFAATLLAGCVGISILATSREPLWIDGEVVWSVPPLRSPSPDTTDIKEIAATEAVRLFVSRLRELQPWFVFNADNVADVARVCSKLEGWPQLILTAAARAQVDGLSEVSAHLDPADALEMLDDTREVPRQRSLRASLDWGAAALDEPDRALLARLSAFGGGWTLASAEAVCADALIPQDRISRTLTRLWARSFIQVDSTSDPPRYRMSDVVREYCRTGAPALIDVSAVERRLADYLVGLCKSPPASLVRESDNVIAALAWSTDEHEPSVAFQLANLAYAIWRRGDTPLSDTRRWLGRVLEMDFDAEHAVARARVACLAANLALLQADVASARQLVEQAGSLQRNLARFVRLSIALATGDSVTAALLLDSGSVAGEEDRQRHPALQIVRARVALELDHLQQALQLAIRVGADARARNDAFWLARASHAQALIALRRRQPAVASWLVQESLRFQSEGQDVPGLIESLCAHGRAELSVGESGAAIQAFSRAADHAQRVGLRLAQLQATEGLACAAASAQPDAAQALFAAVDALRNDSGAMSWSRERRESTLMLRRATSSPVSGDAAPRAEQRAVDDKRWAELASMTATLTTPPTSAPAERGDLLTPREREVAGLMSRGLSNRQIAGRMAISIGTVRSHVEHILMKLGLHSRAQVALWAMHEPRTVH